MPAIWDNPFAYAHLKVDRADKHIADIQERLRTSPDSYPPAFIVMQRRGSNSSTIS
jgi:hypothetical protein